MPERTALERMQQLQRTLEAEWRRDVDRALTARLVEVIGADWLAQVAHEKIKLHCNHFMVDDSEHYFVGDTLLAVVRPPRITMDETTGEPRFAVGVVDTLI